MAAEALGVSSNGGCRLLLGKHELVAGAGAVGSTGPVSVCIRPERIVIGVLDGNTVPGVVDRVVYMGPMLQVLIDVEGIGSVQAVVPNQGTTTLRRGDAVSVGMPQDALRVLVASAT
jgi:ABC-type Fe3+/spermidine/putrescine transport system ATPase subunit